MLFLWAEENWNTFSYINLGGNPIIDCDYLQTMYAPELDSLNIEFWREDLTIGQSNLWFFKMSCDKITVLRTNLCKVRSRLSA